MNIIDKLESTCIKSPSPLLTCATGETKLWLSPSAKQHWNPCSRQQPEYRCMCQVIGALKKPLSICQSARREIWNALLVICRVCCGPRKCISALRYQCYYPRLNYACDTGYPTPNKWNLTLESALTFSNCPGCRGFVHLTLPPFPSAVRGNQEFCQEFCCEKTKEPCSPSKLRLKLKI